MYIKLNFKNRLTKLCSSFAYDQNVKLCIFMLFCINSKNHLLYG